MRQGTAKGQNLKYRITVALTLLAALAVLQVSALAAERPTFGVKGGPNFVWMSAKGAGSKINFTGGAFVSYALTPRWSIQTEVNYHRQGGDFISFSDRWDLLLKSTLSLDYLEIPLLVKYTPSAGKNLTPSFYSGPGLLITLDDNVVLETDYGLLDADILNAKSTYWAWVFGGSLSLPVSSVSFVLDGRLTLGLQNFLGEPQELVNPETEVNLLGPDGDPVNLKHHSISVTLGVAF